VTLRRYCLLKYSSDEFRGLTVQLANGKIAPDIYWFGTAANRYDDVRSPGRFNVNMAVQQEFAFTERLRAQRSAEASNLLNSAQFCPRVNAGLGPTFTTLSAAQQAWPHSIQGRQNCASACSSDRLSRAGHPHTLPALNVQNNRRNPSCPIRGSRAEVTCPNVAAPTVVPTPDHCA
jgi:hypothetical protein